eukprot:TRINITY_DN429_c0_g1_i2.p1 TRINITY_DN429_c0_g1~~TRINITY_DN429_c0_g1_i2.p1  ORF type:complete len:486 (-),score=110.22 TRINITY_DN429_c0_g1_i2:131-1588(-)
MLASTFKNLRASTATVVENFRASRAGELNIVEVDDETTSQDRQVLQPITLKDVESMNLKQICLALVKSEEDYVQLALGSLVEFFSLLRIARLSSIDDEIIGKVMVKLESLQQVHNILLQDLKGLIAQKKLIKGMANEFIAFAPFLKVYSSYISAYESIISYFYGKESTSNKFADFVSRQQVASGFRYNTLLEIPNHRLSQYIVYLTALQSKFAETGDTDSANEAKDALKQIQGTLDIVSFQVKDKTSRVAVVTAQEEICAGTVAIVDPARYLVKQGRLNIQYRRTLLNDIKDKTFLVMLFNDMLMIVDTDILVSVRKILRLRSLTCKLNDGENRTFKITDANNQCVICEANSDADCASWVDEITKAAEYQSASLVGAHISDEDFEKMIMKKIPQIPLVDAGTVQMAIGNRDAKEEEEIKSTAPTVRKPPSSAERPSTDKTAKGNLRNSDASVSRYSSGKPAPAPAVARDLVSSPHGGVVMPSNTR